MEVYSHQGIPVLPRDLWRAIIRIIEDDNPLECGNPFTQMVAFQTLAGVSKEFYCLIAERLADESQKQGLEYIPKLLQHEQNKIGVVGTLHRLKESVYGRQKPLIIANYYNRLFRCPICATNQKMTGDTNDKTPRTLTCPDCTSKYGIAIDWQDDGTNEYTERCGGCRRLGTRYSAGFCEGCAAPCCPDCCAQSMMGLMVCHECKD